MLAGFLILVMGLLLMYLGITGASFGDLARGFAAGKVVV